MTTTDNNNKKKESLKVRYPLALAAMDVVAIMKMIEDQDVSVDESLDRVLTFSKELLADSVDRRLLLHANLKKAKEQAKEMKDLWNERQKKIENIIDRLEEKTKEIVEANLEVDFYGSHGKITSHKSPPALKVAMDLKSKSFSNIVSKEDVLKFEVEHEFLTHTTFYQVNNELVKEYLKSGKSLKWAVLTQGTNVRFKIGDIKV
jgi:hypothetical protein